MTRPDYTPVPWPGRTLLVVEDDKALRKFMEVVLRMEGYDVISAPSAEDALQLVASWPEAIPLVISDITLPGMNGLDLVEALCRLRPETRVLYVSGYAEVFLEGVDECRTPDGDLLRKPFTAEALTAKVRDILAQEGVRSRGPGDEAYGRPGWRPSREA